MHGSKRAWMGWRAVCLGLTGALLFGCGAAGSGGIGAGNPDAAAPPGGRDTGVSPDGGEQPQTDAAVSPPDAAALPPDLAEPPPDCEAGAKRCADGAVEVCAAGAWTHLADCPAGTVCAEGECVTPMAVCGDAVCSGTENCATCIGDCTCPDGAACAQERGVCVQGCTPACNGRTCGDDNCGGTCGDCDAASVCDATGHCAARPAACGDHACTAAEGEDCATCPADCGACCGDAACGAGETCATCPADCACAEGTTCDLGARTCVQVCVPNCADRTCGDDGCGGTCGDCADNQICNANGACAAPPARCGDHACDAAGGEDCGTCPVDCGLCCGDGTCRAEQGENCATCLADCACGGGTACNPASRTCVPVCSPACDGRICGDDGCGGSCGRCANNESCSVDGQCVCVPACNGRICGSDGCGGTCGACDALDVCSVDGACVHPGGQCGNGTCDAGTEDCATCPADCGLCCGDGACNVGQGETCGDCPLDCGCNAAQGESCNLASGACECIPHCNGRACGDDGCGGVCGQCGLDANCDAASGQCIPLCLRQCMGRVCGTDGCGGTCGDCNAAVAHCDDPSGQCVGNCVPACDGRSCGDNGCGGVCGVCDPGNHCNDVGHCIPDACNCQGIQACVDGICRDPAVLCSVANPVGLCSQGQICNQGVCVDVGAGCSGQNPNGICPVGQICRAAACVNVDAAVLCDDGNPCTADTFDFVRNVCSHAPTAGRCSDGNGCTTDACVRGTCASAHVAGCIEPPHIDPYVTPTNNAVLALAGSKPAGASIEINGAIAVPESPDVRFGLNLNLHPGENIYSIRSVDRGVRSEAVEVRIVYDITPPATTVTPDGGIFLNGVTVTASSDEPAKIYYTTDGATPDEFSDWFQSVRSFRVFDNTTLRFRAKDPAGNWEAADVSATFEITGDGNGWQTGTTLPQALDRVGATAMNDVIYLVGGSDGHSDQAGAMAYTPATDAWLDLASMAVARSENAVVNVGGAIYTLGGQNNALPLNLVERLTPGVGAVWQARTIMPTTRFGLAAAVYNGRIFAFGGKTNGGRVLDVVEVHDPVANTWVNNVAQLPRARYGAQAITVGDRIYLIGGEDALGRPVPEVDVYDPTANTWAQVAPLPTPRVWPAVMAQSNQGGVADGYTGIVVAGGRTANGQASTAVEEYIVGSNVWRTRTPLAEGRHSAAGVTVTGVGAPDTAESRAFIIGGLTNSALTNDMSYFVVEQDFARPLADMPDARFMHGAAAIGNRIYLVGGRSFQEETLCWSFDPETQSYADMPPLPSVQNGPGVVAVDGLLYVIGGANQFGLSIPTLRSFDPVSGVWTDLSPMNTARKFPAVAVVSGQIWVIGGLNGAALQSVEIYNPADNTWRNGPVLPTARTGAVAAARDGLVYLFGGYDGTGALVGSILRMRNNAWEVAVGTYLGAQATAVQIHDDQIDLFGGRDAGATPLAKVLNYDVAAGAFIPANSRLFLPRDFQAAAYLNGDVYLFGGNETAAIGPTGTTDVQKIRGTCFNGVVDPGETAAAAEPDRISGAGCGAPGGLWVSRGSQVAWPVDPHNPAYLMTHDLTNAGFADGGNDAFDGYGTPISVTYNGVTQVVDPTAGVHGYNVSGYAIRMTSDFAENHLWRLRIEPAVAGDNRNVNFSLGGNLGSDNSTIAEALSVNFRGRAVPYLYTHDNVFGDPPVMHVIVPSLPAQFNQTSRTVAIDQVTLTANAVTLPLTIYVGVSYAAQANEIAAILTDIAD